MTTKEKRERIKQIAGRLKKEYHAEKVILFGSYARGEEKEDSDVDLLVIADVKEKYVDRGCTVFKLTRSLYQNLALAPVVLTPRELEKRLEIGDQFVREIVETGISL